MGGLDLGFSQAGFQTIWANEIDLEAARTYQRNFPETVVDTRKIDDIPLDDIPDDADGFIGGPPCQSWSIAGARKGDDDPRGKVLWTYVKAIETKKPSFFVLENVPGLSASNHKLAYKRLLFRLSEAGYQLAHGVLNAADYGAPQSRKRLFIVGYKREFRTKFSRPTPLTKQVSLSEALKGLDFKDAVPLEGKDRNFDQTAPIQGNHYLDQKHFSYIYMSRNRVPLMSGLAFTVQASGQHAQIHPHAPPMTKVGKDQFIFQEGSEARYRRISIRESARIQTFPDSFILDYSSVAKGYRMVGNAVPITLAKAVADQVLADFAFTAGTYRQLSLSPLMSTLEGLELPEAI